MLVSLSEKPSELPQLSKYGVRVDPSTVLHVLLAVMDSDVSRDPHAGTTALDGQYVRLTTIHGRDFQRYSIDNSIHMVPVDEVSYRLDLVWPIELT